MRESAEDVCVICLRVTADSVASLCVCVCVRRMWLVAQARVQLCEASSAGAGLRGYLSDDWMRMD